MKSIFKSVALCSALLSSPTFAEENLVTYADPPNGYNQQELQAFAKEGRMPVTPRYRQILDFKDGTPAPYAYQENFCDSNGKRYSASISFTGKADQIATGVSNNKKGFFGDLNQRALSFDNYLRKHFQQNSMKDSIALRSFLDGAQHGISVKGKFSPTLAGSIRKLPGTCFTS